MTDTLATPSARTTTPAPAFVLAVVAVVTLMIGASAPSPFYPVLKQDLGFSAATMTAIFAVYAVALLATLLVTGSVSDHLGRRPVISVGFVVLAVSMVAFWHADSVTVLVVARIVQGVAAGLLMSALSAAIVDLEPARWPGSAATLNSIGPLAGLAAGALIAGALLDLTSSALTVVFGGLTVLYLIMAAAVWRLPETSPRHGGILRSLIPRVGVPAPARRPFLRSAPALLAGWAAGGLYLSLGAPLAATELGATRHLEQGLVVTTLAGFGFLACWMGRRQTPRRLTITGTSALAIGTALNLVALAAGSYWGFIAAATVGGAGFGMSFMGIMRSIIPVTPPRQRGELFASVFVLSYLAFGIPAVVAGIAAPRIGLAETTYVYGTFVIVLSAATALMRRFGSTD